MNKIAILLACYVLLAGLSASASAMTTVNGCDTLSTPEETYVLSSDISTTGSCFSISADNITLDGAGYSITGDGNGDGVSLSSISGATIKNININGFQNGISLSSSSGNTLVNNTVSLNSWRGIDLSYSSGNTLTGNVMNSNTYNFGLVGGPDSDFDNNIDISNTVDGRPVYYVKNATNMVFDVSTNAGIFYCIWCDNVTIKDLSLTKNEYGVFFLSTNNSKIENVNASNNEYGIALSSSSGNTLVNNTVSLSSWRGIDLSYSGGNTLVNNNVLNNGDGIFLYSSGGNTLVNNNVLKNNGDGISLDSSGGNTLRGNTMSANAYNFGVSSWHSSSDYTQDIDTSNTVDGKPIYYLVGVFDMVVDSSTNAGYVGVVNSANVTVKDLTLSRNTQGVLFTNTTKSSISNVNASNNYYGIYLSSSSGNTLVNNNVLNNGDGIFLYSSGGNTLVNNNVLNNRDGIFLYSSGGNTLVNNTALNNRDGISIDSSGGNTLVNNTALNNENGIALSSSSGNALVNNTVSSNNWNGISIDSSSGNTLRGNTMSANAYNFYVMSNPFEGSSSDYIQDIDTSNTVDGKPIYYLVGVSDIVIDSSTNAGYVGVVNGVNVTVKDLKLTKNRPGVLFANTTSSSVLDVTVSDNFYGIYFYSSTNNTLAGNTINSNNYYGLWLDSSSSNLIYNNLFFDNPNNAGGSDPNFWNTTKTSGVNIIGGPYIGGNVWADSFGMGFSDTCTDADGDGICDSGYTLASGDVDYLPLLLNFTWDEGAVTPDVTDCGSLNKPGETYVLQKDISTTGSCFSISADNITLDGAGYSITGYGNGDGVSLSSISGVTIKNITVDGFRNGIWITSSSGITLVNNTILNNNYYGIDLQFSSGNTLRGNTMSANTYNFGVFAMTSLSNYIHDIDTSNTVDGKPVYYLVGVSDMVVDSSTNAGYVGVVNGVNVTVKDLKLSKNVQGVVFANTTNSSVLNVTASDNSNGISLMFSSNNTLANNTVSDNGAGIVVQSSSSNTLANNTVSDNEMGLALYFSSNNNALVNNTVLNNDMGIFLYSSSGNLIYNNFFNNTANFNFGDASSNIWNTTKTAGVNIIGGFYLGGNFWAKPDGTGFSETCTDLDGDGICDSEYTLASGNVDYLPLVTTTPSSQTIVTIDNATAPSMGAITVSMTIEKVWDVGVADINLTYDPSVVQVLSVTNADFDFLDAAIDNANGVTRTGVMQMTNPGLDGSVVLANITLEAVGSIGECSALNLSINELKTVGPPEADISASVVNGMFCIKDSTPPSVTNPSANPQSIPEDTDNNPTCTGTQYSEVSQLNVTVMDASGVLGVTANLSAIGGSADQPMSNISDTWIVATNASIGSAIYNGTDYLPHYLQVNATDIYDNSNSSISISLTVIKNGDVNEDGNTTLYDALYLAKNILRRPGFETMNPAVADVNGDCSKTLYDALYLAKNILRRPGFETLR